MAQVVPGEFFTFHVLFVDGDNIPVDGITDATIEIFRYNDAGTKIVLQASGIMVDDPTETGRWVFPYCTPTTLEEGTTIYGLMSGTNPTDGSKMLVEQPVDLISDSAVANACGMTARFVKGG